MNSKTSIDTPLATLAKQVIFGQMCIAIVVSFLIWVMGLAFGHQHSIKLAAASLYGGFLSVAVSFFLALMLLIKARKALNQNQAALAIKGMALVQIGRYFFIVAGVYIAITMLDLPTLPLITTLAACQIGSWFFAYRH